MNSNTPGIKILGERYLASDSQINCDWTCSGIELGIFHSGGDVVFTISGGNSLWRVWVDGEVWNNTDGTPYYVIGGNTFLTVPNVPAGDHVLRVIKVTGYTLARTQITRITLKGNLKPIDTTPKDLYIEYVGDSICCGWGIIGGHTGSYTDQDGSLAYPYLVSEALNADYSITALSGQGMTCGNPGFPKGYEYASALRDSTEAGKYGFTRKADVVIVNIGTNDYAANADTFKTNFRTLLDMIQEKNGADCKILVVYNVLNDAQHAQMLAVCEEMGGADNGVYTLKLNRSSGAYGNHPTETENVAYANAITQYLQNTVLA